MHSPGAGNERCRWDGFTSELTAVDSHERHAADIEAEQSESCLTSVPCIAMLERGNFAGSSLRHLRYVNVLRRVSQARIAVSIPDRLSDLLDVCLGRPDSVACPDVGPS